MTKRAYLIPTNIDPTTLNWVFDGDRILSVNNGIVVVDGSIEGYPETEVPIEFVPVNDDAVRITSLWQAADTYEKNYISGSATALLVLGVIQGLPVSLAIKGWIKTIWVEYYLRKANGSTDYDFSLLGPMPYSVPELMQELGE